MMRTSCTLSLADALCPAPCAEGGAAVRWMYDLALVAGGTLLIALSARLSISLPFTPVPITGQTFAVLLVGALLGAKRGAATVLAYLASGAAGAPVFAGGAGGAAWLLAPTGGYLFGFIAAAYVTGALAERGWDRRPVTTAVAMMLGLVALYLPGLLWLSFYVGWPAVLMTGLFPFLPGCILKVMLAAAMLPMVWAAIGRT